MANPLSDIWRIWRRPRKAPQATAPTLGDTLRKEAQSHAAERRQARETRISNAVGEVIRRAKEAAAQGYLACDPGYIESGIYPDVKRVLRGMGLTLGENHNKRWVAW